MYYYMHVPALVLSGTLRHEGGDYSVFKHLAFGVELLHGCFTLQEPFFSSTRALP